ncbi:hypothetical protein UP10_41715 [Bradyrhizobium sp. LTSPM299]|nr:hypothetical protein UP10_41715 [Bradyrhizobium sp. LTSPM299]
MLQVGDFAKPLHFRKMIGQRPAPRSDGSGYLIRGWTVLVGVGTLICVLAFPMLLWLPLIVTLLSR